MKGEFLFGVDVACPLLFMTTGLGVLGGLPLLSETRWPYLLLTVESLDGTSMQAFVDLH